MVMLGFKPERFCLLLYDKEVKVLSKLMQQQDTEGDLYKQLAPAHSEPCEPTERQHRSLKV